PALSAGASDRDVAAAPPAPPVPPAIPERADPRIQQAAVTGMAIPDRKPQATPQPVPGERKPLIVIDPGHGGVDPGAIGANGIFEKHIALSMARELKRMLENTGRYDVKLTRSDDTYL